MTGIVYTIGVSIQGDDLVNFNGYLVDAQSNVVATAISAANAESESVELFFDSRNIFDNYSGGSLTLGRVDLTVDGNYSTNNVIGTLYDFVVEPINVGKNELLCNKGYILDGTTTNDVSAAGIAVLIPVLVNVADDYRLEAELVNTNDELVATAFATNSCTTGTNVFALTFTSDEIYQNGRSGINAVKNVQLWCGDEMIDANATVLELADSRDIADFVPSDVCVAVDSSSGRFLEPDTTPDGKLSSVRFVFDVTNATGTMVGYDVAAVFMNTNFGIVASIRTSVAVTNGLNQIEITIPASTIAKSGVNGPYRFESIELLPQGDNSCGTTYRPNVLSAAYMAADFGASAIEPCGTPRIVETSDLDRVTFEYSYDALRVGRVVAEVVLADWNGDFAARVVATNDISEIGVMTNIISIASCDVARGVTNGPYAVGCLSLTPDIIGESTVYMDTESLTNIFWQVATPVLSPATKTVFFRRDQPVVMSCATDGAKIRYTLDGSEPTESSNLYVGPLAISSNTVVKAKAFAPNVLPSATVEAEYVCASIIGDNLVQNSSPAHGVSQTVSIPLSGTYQVSFDWTQGGSVELHLSQGGEVRTVVEIPAEAAGATNILLNIAAPGDYELMVCGPSSDESPPASVSNLKISIPGTSENMRRFWIHETENTYGYTGKWSGNAGFKDGKMKSVNCRNMLFKPYGSSSGDHASIITTVVFEEAISDNDLAYCAREESAGKLRLTMGKDGLRNNVFKVLTSEHGEVIWKNVHADGLEAPTIGTPYTFRIDLDFTNGTYSVSLVADETETSLTDGTTSVFAFADAGDSALRAVGYDGRGGSVTSLLGNYGIDTSTFAGGEMLQISDGNAVLNLTDGQADWLNSMGAHDAIKAKVGKIDMEDFMIAYLLNLDLTKDWFGLVTFRVSGIDVTETEVHVRVQLSRAGSMQTEDGGAMRNASINGILKLYGGELPHEKRLLNATKVSNASFGEGDTAIFTYPRSGTAKFFRPVISGGGDE